MRQFRYSNSAKNNMVRRVHDWPFSFLYRFRRATMRLTGSANWRRIEISMSAPAVKRRIAQRYAPLQMRPTGCGLQIP